MNKSFEKTLPEGYKEAFVIDAKGKLGFWLNLVAAFFAILAIVLAFVIIKPKIEDGKFYHVLIFLGVMIAYIILHELVHGLAYKILTGQKLTFGLTLTVAYCGVPDIYVYRKAGLIAVLAPFVTFIPVFLALAFLIPSPWLKVIFIYMLGMHVGGCSGDLYVTGLLLFKLKNPKTLMRDTGPTQTFYTVD